LTKRARHVIDYFSQSEGKRLRSDSLGPEHLFLGLLRDSDSTAVKLLRSMGLNFEVLKRNIEQGLKKVGSSVPVHFGTIPQNSRFARVIETAKDEAKKLGAAFIGTEHLLLAIFREGTSSSLEGLSAAGIDYNVIHDELVKTLEVREPNDQGAKKGQKPNAIDEYGTDLTALATEGILEPVVGRDREIERMIHILSRKTKNNPVLVGDAGVGKTAVAEGLARRIVSANVPSFLKNKRIISLDIAGVVAGTKFRGDFEERMKKILRELKTDPSIILFVDEMHTLLGAGAAEGAIDAANILKPALARGEIQCVGATTIREYRRYVEKDPALERRFQKILINEPSVEDTVTILRGIIHRYEEYHRVKYTDEALIAAVHLSKRYIHDRYLPDKAIDCIDEAGSIAKISGEIIPDELESMQENINTLQKDKELHVEQQEFEKAAQVRDQLNVEKDRLAQMQDRWKKREGEYEITIGRKIILDVIERWTGIKVADSETENLRYLDMENSISAKIIGQHEAIKTIARVIRRGRAGIRAGFKPVSSFLFVGPTGVGKTETAKAVAECVYGGLDSLIRIDMSEYMEKHSVARLIGSPPGYVGFEEGGQLTEKIRKKPYAVILFDEIEKAHFEFFNILLQILDEGELTDGTGRTVSFRDTLIIMTSNIGNTRFDTGGSIGFSELGPNPASRERIYAEIRKTFNPEFMNRIDDVVYFNRLERSDIEKIIELNLDNLAKRLDEREIFLEIEQSVKEYLLEKGFSAEWGARHVKRLIESEIEDTVALALLSSGTPLSLKAVMHEGTVVVSKKESEEKPAHAAVTGRVGND
jgi:ATP-dependent Clp protease ATP-binding subunit ClpC